MKTAKETEAEFRAELQALLNKYRASIEVEEKHFAYYSSPYISIYIDAIYTPETFECSREYTNFELGNYTTYEEEKEKKKE